MVTALIRTVILYLVLIVGLRLTGKRQIGELEPIELVLTMLLSDLASVPMQNFGIPLLNGLVPIVTLLSLSMLLSWCSLHSVRFRSLVCGEPAVIIRDGKLEQAAMRRNRAHARRAARGAARTGRDKSRRREIRHFGDERTALRPPGARTVSPRRRASWGST